MMTKDKTSELFTNVRRGALGLLAGSTAMSAMGGLPETKAEDPSPPNIILILADDLGWTDINCYYDGGTICSRTSSDQTNPGGEWDSNFYFTPNLAKLRKDGMRFTNAYAACMVCGPTRACLLTGKYPARLGIFTNFNSADVGGGNQEDIIGAFLENQLSFDEVTIAKALKSTPGVASSYYVSAHIGKSNLCGYYSLAGYNALAPSAPEYGFDYSIHQASASPNDYWEHENNTSWWDLWKVKGEHQEAGPAMSGMAGANDPDTLWGDPNNNDPCEYLTDSFTTKAIDFLIKWDQAYKSEGSPFFLYLPHFAPHDPITGQAHNSDDKPYIGYFDECKTTYPDGRHDNSTYAAMIYSLDESIGKIRDCLATLGDSVANNTVIIFTSDNGGASGYTDNSPLRGGKKFLYEGGLRVPLIVYWPGVTDNHLGDLVCDVPVTSADFFPTFLDMAGISMDYVEGAYEEFDKDTIDGMSICHLLEDPEADPCRINDPEDPDDDDAVFFNYIYEIPTDKLYSGDQHEGTQKPRAVVRQGDYKLIKKYDGDYEWPTDFNTETGQLKYDSLTGTSYELYKIGVGDSYNWDPNGEIGGALELDGIVGHAVIPGYKGITGTNPRTVSAWIKTQGNTSSDPNMTIVSWGANSDYEKWIVRINADGFLELDTGGTGNQVTGTTDLTDDGWHHVVVTYEYDEIPDGNDIKLYIGGTMVASDDLTVTTGDNEDVKMGGWLSGEYFDGSIDDVRIFSRALDPCDIVKVKDNDPCLANDPCLVGYWELDETDGMAISDSSVQAINVMVFWLAISMKEKIFPLFWLTIAML
jgi:arylsulfatase A-like enzyme